MLPHKVTVVDAVYSAVLLAYGRSLSLLPTMVGCLQSGLQVLCRSFSNVVIEEDKEANVVVGSDCEPKMKTLNPHVELLYTYFMT